MKILLIGYGSVGKRHIKNLKKLPDIELALFRSSKNNPNKENIPEYHNLEKGLEWAEAVLITSPTSTHVKIALEVAKAGKHMFIEKPLSHNTKNLDKLLDMIKQKDLVVMVGYNMRFIPELIKTKQLIGSGKMGKVLSARIEVGSYLPDWHPEQDYRKSPNGSKQLGGGVILNLSHEIDYALWLFGNAKEITCLTDKVSDLEIDTEDVAEILMKTDKGIIVNIHLDYLQRPSSRTLEITGSKETIKLDLSGNIDQSYIDEITHFLDCVKTHKKTIVNELDGKKVMDVITKCQ